MAGSFSFDPYSAQLAGNAVPVGAPMSWTLEEIRAGQMEVIAEDGSIIVHTWMDASKDPGWCKLDWVIADKTRGQLANASNVLGDFVMHNAIICADTGCRSASQTNVKAA